MSFRLPLGTTGPAKDEPNVDQRLIGLRISLQLVMFSKRIQVSTFTKSVFLLKVQTFVFNFARTLLTLC